MAYGDDTVEMLGDESLFLPEPMQVQQALARNVRRNPALVTPSSGVQMPKAAPPAAAGPQVPKSEDLLRQLTERMYERLDPAAFQKQARERGEQSDRDLALGLAMQTMGGEDLKPIGGQVLQRALKAKDEFEIPGGWGHVSRSGDVVWNPAKLNEMENARLTKLYEITAGNETKRDLARERAADRRALQAGTD